jgi:hypothetical protein
MLSLGRNPVPELFVWTRHRSVTSPSSVAAYASRIMPPAGHAVTTCHWPVGFLIGRLFHTDGA